MTSPHDPDLSSQFAAIPETGLEASSASEERLPHLDPSPARNTVRKRRLAAFAGSAAWLLTHLAVYGVRSDFHELPALYIAAQILLPFLAAVASLFAALSNGKWGLGSKLGLVSGLALLGPLAFCLIALGAPVPRTPGADASSLLGLLVCFDITVAWTAVPLLCAALTLSGAFATLVRWRSALVGAALGLFAGATMNLHCPNVAPLHVLLGHGLPVLIATLLGALVLAYRTRA